MKKIYTILIAVLITANVFSQDLLREQHYSAGNIYQATALKDYNNDGIVDVWSANNTNNHIEIWTYSNDNDTLVKVDSIYDGFPSPGSHIHDIDAADLDGDGDVDAVATFRNSGTYLCINEGSGNWTLTHLDNTYGWQTIIADYNKDGNLDILISTDYSYLKIYYGDGTGAFTAGAAPSDGGSAVCHGVNAIDINGDNYLDIIGVTQRYSDNTNFMRAYTNKLNETTPAWSSSIASNDNLKNPDAVQSSKFSAADLNNDGYIDQVYFSASNGNIVALMGGESNGNLVWTADTILKNFSTGFVAVSVFDIDGDNDIDVIAGGRDKFDGVVILYNDGNGNFTSDEVHFGFGLGNYHDFAMGDIDGNGTNDIIGAQYDIDNNTDDGFHIFFFKKNKQLKYVNLSATGNNDGTSWEDAYTDFQSALSSAEKGDTIWVAAGTYKPSVDVNGNDSPTDNRTKTFNIPDSVFVFGGFNATETELNQRDFKNNETILSGDIEVLNDSSDNCYNVVRGHDYIVLDGFTVSDGNADGTTNNETDMGGGMLNKNVNNVRIANCNFKDNAGKQGAGIANDHCNGVIYIDSCIFYNNIAGAGAAIGNWDSKIIIKYSLFANNIADANINSSNFGGGIYNWGSGSTGEVTNCTFIENEGNGSAIHNRGVSSTCKNTIFWQNSGGDIIANTNGASCNVTYCDIDQAAYETGTGCFNSDPLFCKISETEYNLQSNSPCIDAGDPDPAYNDPDGSRNNLGANHGICNINIKYVSQSATGYNNGTSWENAYTDFQSALSNAEKGDTIWVAAGTYKPSVDVNGNDSPTDNRTKTFNIPDSVFVFGGFNATETELNQRDFKNNETILSGDIEVLNDSSDNCYNVVRGHDYIVLDGFTVSDGNADGTTNNETDMGGGMLNKNVNSVSIANCNFKDNAGKQGSGIANYFCTGSILIDSCIFYNNIAGAGAAIGNWDSKIIIKYSLFANNIADANINSSNFGGGIYNWGSGSTGEVTNCTFIENEGNGSAIHNRGVSSTCKNTIFWQNSGGDIIANTNGASCNVTYCDIDQAAYETGTGCFNSDPLFCKISETEYNLQSNSPCIDAGDPDPAYNDPDGSRNNLGANHNISTGTEILTQPEGTTICSGENLNLSISASGSNLTYQWQLNGVDIVDSVANTYSVANATNTDAGEYTCIVSGDCGNVTSDIATVVVNPQIVITMQPEDTTIVMGGTGSLKVVASGNISGYQWYFNGSALSDGSLVGGSIISGTNTSVLTISNAYDVGDFYCEITGDCGPVNSDSAFVDIITAIKIKSVDNISIYPNPTKGKLQINAQGLKSIKVMDLTGRVLMEKETETDNVTIDLQWLKQGTYLVQFEYKNGVGIKKINKIN